jgi:hypothetical protein
VVSGRIQIPPDLDRDGIEHYRETMERLLNRLTDEAAAWAESGTRKIGQVPCRRQPSPLGSRFDDANAVAIPIAPEPLSDSPARRRQAG